MSKLFTAEDNNIMAWGKYKGQYLSDVPDRYIIWSWEETDLKDHIEDSHLQYLHLESFYSIKHCCYLEVFFEFMKSSY